MSTSASSSATPQDTSFVTVLPPIGADGCVECPSCHSRVRVGIAGASNLKRHQDSERCRKIRKKNQENQREIERKQKVRAYFTASASKVPPTVVAPQPIHSTGVSGPSISMSTVPHQPHADTQEGSQSNAKLPTCKVAATCLTRFRTRISALNADMRIEEAPLSHPLAAFSGDPTGCVSEDEDAWEKWDGPLNTLLQREPKDLQALVVRGERGLLGLHRFLHYLAVEHNIPGGLIEGKIDRLINAMDTVSPQTALSSPFVDPQAHGVVSPSPAVIDVDACSVPEKSDIIDVDAPAKSSNPTTAVVQSGTSLPVVPVSRRVPPNKKHSVSVPCKGLKIDIPPGKTGHSAYPFSLHQELGDPWDYSSIGGEFILRARGCFKIVVKSDSESLCGECEKLKTNGHLLGILDRMRDGVHRNAPFAYHGTGGLVKIAREKSSRIIALRLRSLNDARKIVAKSGALDDHKDWIMAIGSQSVERVERLVRNAIAQKRGIRGLIKMHSEAAKKVYPTRNYSEEDWRRGILLWRLGGARVAEIAHKSLSLPSLRTLRRVSKIPPLIASSGQPTTADIEANTQASMSMIIELVNSTSSVVHQILGFDEIKVEERPRWDERTNDIVGLCREHAESTSLAYTSKQEADLLFEMVTNHNVHLATNATVGAICILSDEHRLYSALPVLISGQCGRESGKEHSKVIQTTINGTKVSRLRTICLASDGESRRGEAFAILTFKHVLKSSSPIYPRLSVLCFMNLEVGDDDLTADKDYKHVFKRMRNLLLRQRGLKVHGIHILPSVIRSHLLENGSSFSHVNSILKPEDKQDVKLAYDLLREISALPSISASNTRGPGFQDTREAFRTIGLFFRNIIMPYICIDLSLTEQLTFLSTAAHMLLAMIHEDKAGTLLMPTQLYVDIMIMIKNVYFCVAKTQADNPGGNFYLMLLGTDRLEELFGILRTMVGNDSSLDVYQLVLRLVGTTEVSGILAQHPEWDRAPRRLKLPTLSKDGFEVYKDVDHIKPASWRGDVNVDNVNLKTCWLSGRQLIKYTVPRLDKVLQGLETHRDPSINILQPFGKHIVLAKRDLDDYDDTAEDFDEGLASGEVPVAPVSLTPPKHPLATDIEDAAGEEEPVSKHSPCFEHENKKIYKARYLKELFKSLNDPGSRDRLKRYADIPRYAIKNARSDDIVEPDGEDSALNMPSVKMDFPLATLLKCEGRIFVCVGEVIEIVFGSKAVDSIPFSRLSEPSTFIQFQLLYLTPATTDDDPELKNDWRWSHERGPTYRVPGKLVEPVNPDISTKETGRPFYLFDSQTLQGIGSLLLERLVGEDGRAIPEVQQSMRFPYREEQGKACFVCEDEAKEKELLSKKQCSICLTDLPKSGQDVLKHMAAHIHFDPAIQAPRQPCGLCLRYSQCTFYLTKGKGADASPKVNVKSSTCANLIHFNYSTATTSTAASPCSNVPLRCHECPPGAPAIWRYNLLEHLRERHPHANPKEYESVWKITNSEKASLKKIWDDRLKTKKKRTSKKAKVAPLVISEAHSSRLTLNHGSPGVDNESDESGGEEETANESEDNMSGDEDSGVNVDSQFETDSNTEIDPLEYTADCFPHNAGVIYHDHEGGVLFNDFEEPSPDVPNPVEGVVDSESTQIPNLPAPENDEPQTTVSGNNAQEDRPTQSVLSTESSTGNDTIQNAPTDGPTVTTSGPRTRKRKNQVVIYDCACGEVVLQRDIEAKTGVIECQKAGCETRWFHLTCVELEYPIPNWTCDSCGPRKRRR